MTVLKMIPMIMIMIVILVTTRWLVANLFFILKKMMRWLVANLGKLCVTELGKHCLQGGLEGVHFLRGDHHYD